MRRRLAILVALAACGDDGGSAGTDGGATADGASCVTAIPCTDNNDCASAPGTRCNTALAVPRCQPLECGGAGTRCAGPEFCTPGLVCFDAAHFGESATIYAAGTCSTAGETRAACTTRCMSTWSRVKTLDPCTQPQAMALCQEICALYPAWDPCESYFTQFNANDFRFDYVNCPSFQGLCPNVTLRCGSQSTNLTAPSCSP